MVIREFQVVLRATDFDRTCRFYGEVVGLPRVRSFESHRGRTAVFRAGTGLIEILGRPRGDTFGTGAAFSYQGPEHKLTLTLKVPSAEQAYEEMIFREKNIPGGLKTNSGGTLVFETRDPDGVKVLFSEEA
jgi:catechol 2,3-dioxygenase-like lactoylglutathione lyase family enzyme